MKKNFLPLFFLIFTGFINGLAFEEKARDSVNGGVLRYTTRKISNNELTLGADFSPNLSAILFYTYLDPEEKTKGRPGQKFDFSLRFRGKSLYASLQAQYVTDYFADDFSLNPLSSYFLLNSRLNIKVSPALELFLDINNILNKDYMIHVDLPGLAAGTYLMPGRNLNLGIRMKQ